MNTAKHHYREATLDVGHCMAFIVVALLAPMPPRGMPWMS